MLRRRVLTVLWLAVLAMSSTQIQAADEFFPGWGTCQELKDVCAASSAEAIYAEALYSGPGSQQTYVGTCYVHTEAICPDCACWNYVKTSYRRGQKGWDGGTGCLGTKNSTTKEQSKALAAAKLKELCESGACCCPPVEPRPCPDATPTKARDGITGSCCTFPNSCSVPSGWTTAIPPGACG